MGMALQARLAVDGLTSIFGVSSILAVYLNTFARGLKQNVYHYMYQVHTRSKSKFVSLKERKSERSPRFAALFSTRSGPFRLLLPPPSPSASTAPGEGLHGGLLEGSCGWRRCRVTRNRLNVGTYAPASEYENRSFESNVWKNIRLYIQ